MAAPANTARTAPAGRHLYDGFSTLIAFSRDANASFWERSITPPKIEGGDPIEITTMHNVTWRTKWPRKLKDLEPYSVTAAYDPILYSVADARENLINQPGSVTIQFPDGSDLDHWGYLQSIEPAELQEGEFPMVTLVIVPTQVDPGTASPNVPPVEAVPVFTTVAGT